MAVMYVLVALVGMGMALVGWGVIDFDIPRKTATDLKNPRRDHGLLSAACYSLRYRSVLAKSSVALGLRNRDDCGRVDELLLHAGQHSALGLLDQTRDESPLSTLAARRAPPRNNNATAVA